MRPRIVFLASAWGPQHGGINSFNRDLVEAVSRSIRERSIECLCISATAPSAEEFSHAKTLDITLRTAKVHKPERWTEIDTDALCEAVSDNTDAKVIWCVGHDLITGEAAVSLAQRLHAQSAVIHHTSYIDYGGYKNSVSRIAHAKKEEQRRVFLAADRAMAVGPLLQQRLAEMIGATCDNVTMLIPGLNDLRQPPVRSRAMDAIVFGRLDSDNDRVKQGTLSLAAFATAIRMARKEGHPATLIASPRITLIGADPTQEKSLKTLASRKANGVVNVISLPFMDDRERLQRALAQSNLAIVASWHEGFALTAWEAVGAQVPLIVGKNTGIYHFLNSELSGAHVGFVRAVDVRGALGKKHAPQFRTEDERELSRAITEIASDLSAAQERARLLKALLSRYTWSRTAAQLVTALGIQQYAKRLADTDSSLDAAKETSWQNRFRRSEYESPETAAILLAEARATYGKGNYEQVYLTALRAADAFERCNRHSDAVSALVEAISALRPGRKGTELRRIILRVYRICGQHMVDRAVRWLFLDRFALVLFDYARFSKAAQVIAASEKLFQRVSPEANPQARAFDSSNSLRRRTVIKGSDGHLGAGGQLRRALDELTERAEQFRSDGQFNSYATNLDVASKLAAEVLGDIELAHAYTSQVLDHRGDIDHWWVLQEHLWREAEYFKARNDMPEALKMVVEALKLQERAPVILEPVAGKRQNTRSNLKTMIDILGVKRLDIAERGVSVTQLTPTPLSLQDLTIDKIVEAVMK